MPGKEDTKEMIGLRGLVEAAALRQIVEGTAKETGEDFFAALVEHLAKALATHGAWVTITDGHARRLRAVAFWLGDRLVPDYEYDIAGTPCEPVFEECRLVHIRDNVIQLYPDDPDLKPIGAVSYLGVPLLDVDGKIFGPPGSSRSAPHSGRAAGSCIVSYLCGARRRGAAAHAC